MAVLSQERHVELVSGANEAFVVTSLMVSASIPTQLPHLSVFVMSVPDVDDPKQDTLVRVATIADLTLVPIGRSAGIAAPGGEGIRYLSASTTNIYDTLETAIDAATAIKDRVNALINAWVSFRTTFNAPTPTPALYTLPAGSSTQATTLIAAYKTAKQDRYLKKLAKDEADAALARAQADYAYKQGLVADSSALDAAVTVLQTDFGLTTGAFSTLLAAGQTFHSGASGAPGAATFFLALVVGLQEQAAQIGYTAAVATAVAEANNFASDRTTDADAADTALTAALSDQSTKAQQLTAAQTVESAALAAVLAVCPDFDKHSIPFVDDNEP